MNCPVKYSIPKAPYIKPKGFMHHLTPIVLYGIPFEADVSVNPNANGTPEHEAFWNAELNKIVNGFWIKDIWIPGRFYFYMNYKQMSTINGVITPDMVDLHLELAYYIEHCIANGKNLLCAKGRRKGISEAATTMVIDYGWRFSEGFKAGVAAGNKTYVEDFVAKWRFSDSRMPVELSTKKITDNDDEIVAGYSIKNTHNTYEEKGTFNTIYARTMHNNPNMFKGLYLNAVVSEELGEHENWIEFYGATRDCLMSGNNQVGLMIAFGTAGNVNKGSKDFKTIWQKPEAYNFVKFFIPADRFYCYGGARNANQRLPSVSKLYKDYKEYQLVGVEDREYSLNDILEKRAELLKTGQLKKYNEDLQNNPVNESDMFRKTIVNNFDTNKLNEIMARIDARTHPAYTKYKMDWVKDEKGMIKMPMAVNLTPLTPNDDQEKCIWILDGELPRKNFTNLYNAGCLLPGGKVMTDFGLMSIEDVTLNHKLINEKGDYVAINELQRYFLQDESVYDIRVSNTLRSTKFTSEHPILTSSAVLKQYYRKDNLKYAFNQSYWDFKGFEYTTVDKVVAGDWIKVPNIYRKPNDFDINTLWSDFYIRYDHCHASPLMEPEFWWFIGLWLGDGWVQRNSICVSFNIKEVNYINRFKNFAKTFFGRSTSSRTRNNCVELTFSFKQLSMFLTEHFGKYSYGKRLPEWAKHINEECKKLLVTGYLNSDGCIGTEKKRNFLSANFVSINLELLESFQDVLFSLGIISSLHKLRDEKIIKIGNKDKASNVKVCYQLVCAHHDTLKLVQMLKTDNLDHKLNKVDFNNLKQARRRPNDGCFIDLSQEFIYFQIREIKQSSYTGVVYNFDCETHTFMCHHITTHNCDSYDQDVAKESKSLGAMCIRIRANNITWAKSNCPVAIINCRPSRKEAFYELCLQASVLYNLERNVLVDVGAAMIMQYFAENGGWKYLADRPRKFESEASQQTHEKGVRLTTFSRPRMSGLMQSDILNNGDQYEFPELVNQLGNFDEVEIGSDNDLADAFGLALMQDVSCDVRPRDNEAVDMPDRFNLPTFDANGKMLHASGPLGNIQQDSKLFGMMFGKIPE